MIAVRVQVRKKRKRPQFPSEKSKKSIQSFHFIVPSTFFSGAIKLATYFFSSASAILFDSFSAKVSLCNYSLAMILLADLIIFIEVDLRSFFVWIWRSISCSLAICSYKVYFSMYSMILRSFELFWLLIPAAAAAWLYDCNISSMLNPWSVISSKEPNKSYFPSLRTKICGLILKNCN